MVPFGLAPFGLVPYGQSLMVGPFWPPVLETGDKTQKV